MKLWCYITIEEKLFEFYISHYEMVMLFIYRGDIIGSLFKLLLNDGIIYLLFEFYSIRYEMVMLYNDRRDIIRIL